MYLYFLFCQFAKVTSRFFGFCVCGEYFCTATKKLREYEEIVCSAVFIANAVRGGGFVTERM